MVKYEQFGGVINSMMTNNESLEKLTSKMVHDVRNPVTILQMLAYSLKQKAGENNELQEDLSILEEETNKINAIVTEYREKIKPFF